MLETLGRNFWWRAAMFATAVSAFFGGTIPGFCQNFRVQAIMVCSNTLTSIDSPCTEVKAPFDNLDKRQFSNNRVHFKLTINCEKEGLSFIDSNDNVLPVYIAVWKDGGRKKGDLSVGITQDRWEQDGNALRNLLDQNGNFPWRTRFNLGLDGVRTVAIQVNDAQKNVTFIGRTPARLELSFSN
jgi:hypothetical protein